MFKIVMLLVVAILVLAAIAAWSAKRRHRKGSDDSSPGAGADTEPPRSKHRNRTWDAAVAKARRFRR